MNNLRDMGIVKAEILTAEMVGEILKENTKEQIIMKNKKITKLERERRR